MRKIILLSLLALIFISCQITERVYLSESGKIRQEMEIDVTALMSFATTPEQIDSLREIGEFPLDKVVSMKESEQYTQTKEGGHTPAQDEFIEAFDKTNMRIIMNENESKFIIMTNEMGVKEYNAYQEKINKAYQKYEKEDPKNAEGYSSSGYGTMLWFSYNEKGFERKSLNEKIEIQEEETDDSLGISVREFMNMNTYKIEYHFEKPIKSTTLKNAEISADKKTVTADVPMADLLENPEDYNFEVKF